MTTQRTIPGCEPISDREHAERLWRAPLRPTRPQTQLPTPLFSDMTKQADLIDYLNKERAR